MTDTNTGDFYLKINKNADLEKEFDRVFNDALRREMLMGSWDIGKSHEMYEDRYKSGSPISYWHVDKIPTIISDVDQSAFRRAAEESLSGYIARQYSNFSIQEERKMYVYHVVVVDTEKDEIVSEQVVVASSKDKAHDIVFANIMREIAPPNETIVVYHFAIEQIGNGYQK